MQLASLDLLFSRVLLESTARWIREKSRALLAKRGFPTEKEEAFSYLPFPLWKMPERLVPRNEGSIEEINKHILPECSSSYVVMVNGFYEEALSLPPPSCVCLSFEDALNSYGVFLQNRINRAWKEEFDPFAFMNGMFYGNGVFLYVPPHISIEPPLQIIHLVTDSGLAAKRVHLSLGNNASMRLVQTTILQGKGSIATDLSYFDLSREAQLDISSLLEGDETTWLFHAERASLKQSSRLSSFSFTEGALAIRQSLHVSLLEERAEAVLKGLWVQKAKRSSHVQVKVEHVAPHCFSRQHFKGVLKEESRSSFCGEIFVHSEAQKTEAYQLNQNLVLSDCAFAASKPNLQIFADDVKASHGAVFSQLNEEEVFYLRSRGFSPEAAKQLLIEGFIREMCEQTLVLSLKELLCKRSLA